MGEPRPVVKYLLSCSKPSLESFELARLNLVANLRKELRDLVERWVDAEVEARLARVILDQRRNKDQSVLVFPDPAPEPFAARASEQRPQLRASGQMGLCLFLFLTGGPV